MRPWVGQVVALVALTLTTVALALEKSYPAHRAFLKSLEGKTIAAVVTESDDDARYWLGRSVTLKFTDGTAIEFTDGHFFGFHEDGSTVEEEKAP